MELDHTAQQTGLTAILEGSRIELWHGHPTTGVRAAADIVVLWDIEAPLARNENEILVRDLPAGDLTHFRIIGPGGAVTAPLREAQHIAEGGGALIARSDINFTLRGA